MSGKAVPCQSGQRPEHKMRSARINHMSAPIAWLSLGGNVDGRWGSPIFAMRRAIACLERNDLEMVAQSGVFATPPVGRVRQGEFTNMVIAVSGAVAPASLLRLAKRIERAAGRRSGVRWGPRPLDIDILGIGGRQFNARGNARVAGRLVLPHPEMVRRGFVLVPLAQIAPKWRHPTSGRSARSFILRYPVLRRGIRELSTTRGEADAIVAVQGVDVRLLRDLD
jgi:2-amino-4-hydroxy-6-hydroxymethyldihydropteridine diphosphokinase